MSTEDLQNLIVENFKKLATHADRQHVFHKLLEIPDLQLVGIATKHSIRLYFLCLTSEALRALRRLVESVTQEQDDVIQLLLNYLLSDDTQSYCVQVEVKYRHFIDYCKCDEYLAKG